VVSARHIGGAATTAARWAEVRCTGRADGDMGNPTGEDRAVLARRRAVIDRPWTTLRQVHGSRVVVVDEPRSGYGEEADGAVTSRSGVPLAVLTADCAPVALASPEGIVGVAHAGWRGLLAGVIEQTVDAMRDLGATRVVAARGPCIHAECYQFGPDDLDRMTARFGDGVRGRTRDGGPALDLPAAVDRALAGAGAELVATVDDCTSCSADSYWSWRARGDRHRQAMVVWRP
jgi:YfiH family protein